MKGPTTGRTKDASHDADRMPTEDGEEAADRSAEELRDSGEESSVAQHHQDMARRGVEQKGEGRID